MTTQPSLVDGRISFWRKRSKEDSDAFYRRWMVSELREEDPNLFADLHEQEQDFVAACVTGTEQDIEAHGASLCRGWLEAVWAMEKRDRRATNGPEAEGQASQPGDGRAYQRPPEAV
jgi:hypothetical protein